MKLKQQTDDFHVEELTDVKPGEAGSFAFYRLEKRGWTTPDALAALRRRWQVDLRRLSYGGLKDRHAHTVQYMTIAHGPRRRLTHQGIAVEYLGQLPAPYTSHDVRANRFRITLRSLQDGEVAYATQALDEVRREGVPNYFDDQRFGSVSEGGFVAREFVLGNFEEALKLALAAPYEHDRAAQKEEKATLRACWGDWPACRARLRRGHVGRLVEYLVGRPTDFRGALERLRPELTGLYMSAYQSHLWNRMLARRLREDLPAERLLEVPMRLGEMPFHQGLDDEQLARLRGLALPLPTARTRLGPEDPHAALVESVLAEDGLRQEQMKVKGSRSMFFSKGDRPALCLPQELSWQEAEDEVNPGRGKLELSFDLTRGSYATLIVKRITRPGV